VRGYDSQIATPSERKLTPTQECNFHNKNSLISLVENSLVNRRERSCLGRLSLRSAHSQSKLQVEPTHSASLITSFAVGHVHQMISPCGCSNCSSKEGNWTADHERKSSKANHLRLLHRYFEAMRRSRYTPLGQKAPLEAGP
jgi:hypothetical protein